MGSSGAGCRPYMAERNPSLDHKPAASDPEDQGLDSGEHEPAATGEEGDGQSSAKEPSPGGREEAPETWFAVPESQPCSAKGMRQKLSSEEDL